MKYNIKEMIDETFLDLLEEEISYVEALLNAC